VSSAAVNERAAVVKWLRGAADGELDRAFNIAADRISAGDHRGQ
jgi:hypothetical protein